MNKPELKEGELYIGAIIWRYRFLRAYRNDIKNESGSLYARQELARRFNANKFWFQKHIEQGRVWE